MLDRITASLPALAPAEQRVARLVLADPRAFASLPVSELAERAQVSKPTVVRCCRSLGYDGLSDFKLRLAGSVGERVPFAHRSVDADDTAADVLGKVVDNTVAALLKYRNDASPFAIDKACTALALAGQRGQRIDFYGLGPWGAVAQDAQQRFFALGLHTHAHTDGYRQRLGATLAQPGDCVVAVSGFGREPGLLEAGEIARRNGASVIAITATASPLAGAAHVHLGADHAQDPDADGLGVLRLLHLTILDVLGTAVALRLGLHQPGEPLQAWSGDRRGGRRA